MIFPLLLMRKLKFGTIKILTQGHVVFSKFGGIFSKIFYLPWLPVTLGTEALWEQRSWSQESLGLRSQPVSLRPSLSPRSFPVPALRHHL